MRDGARVLVATLDGLDTIPVAHGLLWRPIRRRFDLRGFGVNAYTAEEVGGQVVEEHTEERLLHRELYVVVRGRATFKLDGEEVDAPAVSFVHVSDPYVRRVATARTPDTVVLALGGRPGEPFAVSAWEATFAAMPAARVEDWDEAIRIHEEALAEQPDQPLLLYNLACMEARGRRPLDALRHLQRAVERDPQTADWAQGDSDFASIRAEQGFPAGGGARPAKAAATAPRAPGTGWRVAQLDELPCYDGWTPVRVELGFEPLGVNVWGGEEPIADHDEIESGHEELYLVLSGRATFTLDGSELDAPEGTLVAVDPRVHRSARSAEPGTRILTLGATPGEAFVPCPWESRRLARVTGQAGAVGESP